MNKIYILVIVVLSFVFTNIVGFLDEGVRTFDYLKTDIPAIFIYTILFVIIPLIIYFRLKTKPVEKKFIFSLIGFFPALIIIMLQCMHYPLG